MRVALLCATRRGYRFLERLSNLKPECELIVFSFREEPWEPAFFDDIQELARSRGGQFYEGRQLGSKRWEQFWETTPIDLMLTVSWRYLIPPRVFNRPCLGTFVFHDSLLPEYRGFSPTVWAILNGEDHTGVTLFRIAEAVDSGNIVDQQRVPIGKDDAIAMVMERVTDAYLQLLDKNLDALLQGSAIGIAQDQSQATFTCKRLPEDNLIDWNAPTEQIYNLIRAVSAPYPGAYTFLNGKRIRIWSAKRLVDQPRYVGRIPGRVVDIHPGAGSVVLTKDGMLLLTQVQLEDGEIVSADKVLNSLSQTLGR